MLPPDTTHSANGGPEALVSLRPNFRTLVDWESHLEVLPLAAWIGNPDGSAVYVNQAYRRMLGISELDDVLDGKWMDFLHPKDRKEYVRSWNTFMESSAARFRERVRWVRPDNGQTIRIKVRAQRLDSGKLQGWIRENTADQALAKLEELIS